MSGRRRIGLLGAGYIIDSHAKALLSLPDVVLQAVCDSARGRAVNAASRYGIPNVFSSIEELADSDCDAVHVLLPPPLHLSAAGRLIDAGKSVFLEKPMGLDSAACAALAERAARQGLAFGVNHNFLFSRGYERLRAAVKSGELGRIDHLSCNWHFTLPLLQYGPYDNWMIAAPANLFFELGSHAAAFVVDLVGAPQVVAAVVGRPIALPGNQTVYRHWTAVMDTGAARATISLAVSVGHADRLLQLRGRGASAHLDFGRDIYWKGASASDNPIFDSYASASEAGAALRRLARVDRLRRLRAALAKRPDANPFEESIYRSIRAFHKPGGGPVDSRHDPNLGIQVIRLCEAIAAKAGVNGPSTASLSVSMPRPSGAPSVLVVGGTGFIGRRLVRGLVERGYAVRLLTRNGRAAAIELDGLPVELFAGSHGDSAQLPAALEGISVVYHLAKCEGKRWADYVEGDIIPTRILAEAALAAGVRRFIYTGTIASYASDGTSAVIDHHTPVDPGIARRGHYARSKAACEALLQDMQRRRGLPLVILRPGIVLGEGSPPAHPGVARFASETRVDYWGDGSTPLPLVLVDDVADALVRALNAPAIEGQTLLLTSPPLLSASEYVKALAECLEAQIDARSRSALQYWIADLVKELAKNAVRHPNRRWPTLHDWRCNSHSARFDASQTEQVLGWHPVADRDSMIRRGIAEPVAWFLR